MNLRQLKNFMIVYEEGGFGKAAVRLNSTQPGLSVQIASLEGELNVKLFDRHARGVKPTPAGKQLYLRGRKLLDDANGVVQEIQSMAGAIAGTVSAGITPALGRSILASVLAEYVEKYRNVDIKVSEDYSATLVSLLESGSIDFALLAHIPNHPTIEFKHFYQDRFVVVSSRGIGFKSGAAVRLNIPPYHKYVVPSVHHGVRSGLDNPFRTGQIVSARTIEVNSVSGVLEFVSRTDWLGLLPYTSIHNGIDKQKLRINPIAGHAIRTDYYIAVPSTQPISVAADAFITIAKQELQKIDRQISGSAIKRRIGRQGR